MFRLSLKSKLVLAMIGMVFLVVVLFCYVYISHRLRQSTTEAYTRADFVAKEISDAARRTSLVDLSQLDVNLDDPAQVQAALKRQLQDDKGLHTLLQSILAYSYAIYDAGIYDVDGRAIVHTDSASVGSQMDSRPPYGEILSANFFKPLRIIYGPPAVYDVAIPINSGTGQRFGSIRVGISTVFLQHELTPQLTRALIYSGVAILLSLLLAGGVSNIVLRPLEAIGRRLDLMTAEAPDNHPPADPRQVDEFGMVHNKIDRLGRQMADVKQDFSALKGNVDQFLGSLQDGVVLFTRDNHVVLASASSERFLGRSQKESLGKSLEEVFTDRTKLGRIVLDAFALQQAIPRRVIEMENGQRVEIAVEFIAERGERIGALVSMRDAESARKLENELEVSHRMAAIGRLTSGVAHEVKNPINAIVVHLELLKEKLRSPDKDAGRHVDIIESEIQRLDRVVKTLADFNRPIEPRFISFDLRRIVEDVTLLAAPDAARHGVRIETVQNSQPMAVTVDGDLMKQALLNIVLNGVQSMEHGGSLQVMTSVDNNQAVVSVKDHGRGIPPEIRDRVFSLFFTTRKNGTGIGLAMSYRILQLHYGSLSFESELGAGTTFRLAVPLAAVQSTENTTVSTAL